MPWSNTSPRDLIHRRYFPDVALTTHEGKRVRLFDDLIRDKIVVINFFYATCEGICAPITANTGSVRCMPFIETSPRGSVWKLPIVRSSVFFEITIWPGLATPLSSREAMFTALPSTV